MAQADLTPGPGNFVKDTLAPVLISDAADTEATTTVSYQQVNRAWDAAVVVAETGTVTGTTPTCDIAIWAADDSSGTNAVQVAAFRQLDGDDDDVRLFAQVRLLKPYLGAVATVAGTDPVFPLSVTVRDKDFWLAEQESEGDLS